MTSLLDLDVEESHTTTPKDSNHNICHRHRNVLKPKVNTYKQKCKKILKRKLKKYKLRQDGKEDQDIIDVSNTLVTSLFIRSPNKPRESIDLETEQDRQKNYLFRMVRRKQTTLKSTKSLGKVGISDKDEVMHVSPTTEQKKQTNAFKLLMESRNKSLGTNSPGKEKPNNELDTQEIIEKKTIKAKRTLMLQKMADSKGALERRVIEEQHDKYIQKKMVKRAEKLKNMILHKEPQSGEENKKKKEERKVKKDKERSPLDCIEVDKNTTVINKSVQKLQLVNIFNESIEEKVSPEKKLTKEDKEFLNKLSPSIRKKESMLSYFKKIEKEPESCTADTENDNNIIKVKLAKPKKKGRKKRLSLIREADNCEVPKDKMENLQEDTEVIIVVEVQEEHEVIDNETPNIFENTTIKETSIERKKRKRDSKDRIQSVVADNGDTDEKRPKRMVKRPVKYNDDATLTSSDEELHIFTPKKKKRTGSKDKTIVEATDDLIIIDDTHEDKSKFPKKPINGDKFLKKEKKLTNNVNSTKPVKLAPIFSKPQPNAAAIEAKQKFLQSGVPEQLKKMMSKQRTLNTGSNIFATVVHIQQLEHTFSLPCLKLPEEECLENISFENSETFTKLLNLTTSHVENLHLKINVNPQTVLQNLKEAYPRFPVYRTYKLLRGKKKGEFKHANIFLNIDNSIELNCSIDLQTDNPDQLTWCDKYKALSGNEIIGNFDSIRELKKWLVTWTENDTKSKANGNDSDSSDFYQSEPDSRDSMKSNNNLLILSGPIGCGKTSAVYAVAAELSIKVIEVNSSSRRTGKIMLQDLQEATQSHKVNRGGGSSEFSQKSQEIMETPPEIQVKKRGRPKKLEQATTKKLLIEKSKEKPETNSQESTRTAMSLILIDDADIVFDQDDGFCSAIAQLVQCSKRPVILVTGSLTLPHLHKFLQYSKILKFHALLPNMLGIWLDLMCLADSGICWPGIGAKFLNFYKGDMRKTINSLQFYIGSQNQAIFGEHTETDSQNNDAKFNIDDENSCTSWADRHTDEKNIIESCDSNSQSVWNSIMKGHMNIKQLQSSLNLFDIWWSLPTILKTESETKNTGKVHESLESISNVLDSISTCDYLSHNRLETEANLTSRPWYDAENDSVSELENIEHFDRKYSTTRDICRELLIGSITAAQEDMGLEINYDVDFPGMSIKRKRDRIVSRHHDLTSYLSPQSSLDRKALALDYWASCRAICRIEKSKTDTNSKRNNRFCHYLKSLSIQCKSESFDSLANSLQPTL